MSKIAVFKINHCCLCEENEMRLNGECSFWCKLMNIKLNKNEYADFPDWCPKPNAENLIDPNELFDLEVYLSKKCLVLKTE